ncbi:YhcN/YlaJ family sporulation lipoprotein [Bacillus sp. FJAT-27251]|uniref:YhcN/YlaJ family sporulation lipoprotein n=1 Tax=Bacillus sp. FJAT-27251 TaxID=1684142 RepID=UPI0006A7BEA0|nr:YhcN/YlaJ family sporulation lipoprotein [Bacillus sp. FJAT-27251]
MKHVLMIFTLILLVTGCGAGNNTAREQQDDRVGVKNTAIEHEDRQQYADKANYLAQLAERVPDVENATAIVIGNVAVVGIDVDANLERSEVGSIKYSVAESMKDDPHGAGAIIIADPDMNARLREVAEDFRVGRPLQGILNELADITGRLMPEVPADLIDPHSDKAPQQPGGKLDNQEQQNLEQKQDRQSKHHMKNNPSGKQDYNQQNEPR